MGKLVIFEIGEGSFETGFPVKVRIGEEGKPHSAEITGRLPPASAIPQNYYQWQSVYRNLPANWLITIPQTQITHVSTIEACNHAAQNFQSSLNEWLNQPMVRQLERQLLQKVGDWQNVRFILQTQDSLLRRIPWHLWDVFNEPQPEIVVSSEYEPSKNQLTTPVKILAVLGNSQGINIQQDLDALSENLPGAIIEPLIEPSRKELREKLWTKSWDIFFFAGHSCSEQGDSYGEIELNKNESLSLQNLRHTLRHAVNKGLKLAIFNSCDGLGLARNLADLQIPYTIVMREPVPDIVAQHFLKYFLTAFAAGESLYASVQQARARLQEELEHEYPCASWLPVIFQNPAAAELKYPQLRNWRKIALQTAIVAIATGGIGAIVWGGINEIKFRNRFSYGEKLLVNSVASLDKKSGVQAFTRKNYNLAISKFESSLQQNPNDPETWIYLNNAKIGTDSALKIGVAVPIGSNSNVAQEILRGVAQAQREINNQGGINGKFLKVEIANDDNNVEIAEQIARRFVEDKDNILAVVGHNSSDASLPASNIYQAGKLVMISPTSSSTKLTDRNDRANGNFIYRTVVSFTTIADSLAEYAKTSGITKIVICNDSKAADQSSEQAFVHAMENKRIQQINNIHCDFAAKNFQPEAIIKSATEKGASAILLNPQVDRIDQAIALAKANKGKFTLLGNPSLQTKKTLVAGSAVNGMVMAVPWHATVSPNKDFVQNAYKLWGDADSITWRTATAFDATKAIAAALKKGDTRNGVQQALESNFSLQGATGTIQFLSWGDRVGDRIGNAVLVQVKPNPNPRTGYRFVPKDSIQSRISLGEKILVKDNPSSQKKSGVQAFALGNYNKAFDDFQASLKQMPNDPEARIYLQNALAARSDKILKIAVTVPIGSNLNVAKEMLQGVAQAQEEVNKKGGIQGYLLQIAIASDDNNPDITKQLANYLVAVDKQILAVIGSNASDASVAACPIYQEGKLVNISPTSFSLKLSGCGDYIFRTSPNVRFLADSLSRYALDVANTKKMAICVDEKAIDNQSFRDEFTSAIIAGGGNVVNIHCDFSAPDYNPKNVIADAISNGAEGLVLAPHVDRINKALDLAKANQGRLRLFGSTSLYTSQTLQQGRADVSGLVFAVPWHPGVNFGNDFGKNAQQLWGNFVTWRSATSYDATVAIISGLQQNKTREGLQQVLRNPNFSASGAAGKIQFLQSGDRHIKNNAILVQIQPSNASPTGYEFSLNQANIRIFRRE